MAGGGRRSTHRPGGVVILGSQTVQRFAQYALAWRTWKNSSYMPSVRGVVSPGAVHSQAFWLSPYKIRFRNLAADSVKPHPGEDVQKE
jgi:hypothetical protein